MCGEQGTVESILPSDPVRHSFKVSSKVGLCVLSSIEVLGLLLRTGVPHNPQCVEALEGACNDVFRFEQESSMLYAFELSAKRVLATTLAEQC